MFLPVGRSAPSLPVQKVFGARQSALRRPTITRRSTEINDSCHHPVTPMRRADCGCHS